MRQTLKRTVGGIRSFLYEELATLNNEIIEAAKDGDIIREDVESTKIKTLENLCFWVRTMGISARIESSEIWDFPLNIDGVGAVRQYTLIFDGRAIVCSAYLANKKGA